jgi:hypothetical protein
MPISKKRKKKGRVVKNNAARRSKRLESSAADISAGVSLQDLINVVAYQEYVKDGTIVADDAKFNIPVEMPITTVGEDGTKRRVGTAITTPGSDHVEMRISDPDFTPAFEDDVANFSIEKEN